MKINSNSTKISIITVVYNASEDIEKTLKSIFEQDYSNKEIIVIDGKSTDGTLDIISKFQNDIDYLVSEKDLGIYDAMNKGIKYCNGHWICFMNAGDIFYKNDILSRIFREEVSEDIIIGDCIVDFKKFKRYVRVKNLKLIEYGMTFCHQSALVKTDLYRRKYFDLDYSLAADFNFFYWCYISGMKFKTFSIPISIVSSGGLSDNMRTNVINENRKTIRQYSKSTIKKELIYLMILIWTKLKLTITGYLPDTIVLFLKKLK